MPGARRCPARIAHFEDLGLKCSQTLRDLAQPIRSHMLPTSGNSRRKPVQFSTVPWPYLLSVSLFLSFSRSKTKANIGPWPCTENCFSSPTLSSKVDKGQAWGLFLHRFSSRLEAQRPGLDEEERAALSKQKRLQGKPQPTDLAGPSSPPQEQCASVCSPAAAPGSPFPPASAVTTRAPSLQELGSSVLEETVLPQGLQPRASRSTQTGHSDTHDLNRHCMKHYIVILHVTFYVTFYVTLSIVVNHCQSLSHVRTEPLATLRFAPRLQAVWVVVPLKNTHSPRAHVPRCRALAKSLSSSRPCVGTHWKCAQCQHVPRCLVSIRLFRCLAMRACDKQLDPKFRLHGDGHG